MGHIWVKSISETPWDLIQADLKSPYHHMYMLHLEGGQGCVLATSWLSSISSSSCIWFSLIIIGHWFNQMNPLLWILFHSLHKGCPSKFLPKLANMIKLIRKFNSFIFVYMTSRKDIYFFRCEINETLLSYVRAFWYKCFTYFTTDKVYTKYVHKIMFIHISRLLPLIILHTKLVDICIL